MKLFLRSVGRVIDTHSLQFARFSRAHVVIYSDDCYYLSSFDFALIMPSDQLAALVCTWFTLGIVSNCLPDDTFHLVVLFSTCSPNIRRKGWKTSAPVCEMI